MASSGWEDRAEVIVLNPEIEVWVFAASPHVERCLGWPQEDRPLRQWLESQGLWQKGQAKPSDPRAALERALGKAKRARSSALYRALGQRVGTKNCADPAFVKFRDVLRGWFPTEG